MNPFLMRADLEESDRLIENDYLIVPSARDAKMILNLLDNPPQPNARLRTAMKRHQKVLAGAEDSPHE